MKAAKVAFEWAVAPLAIMLVIVAVFAEDCFRVLIGGGK